MEVAPKKAPHSLHLTTDQDGWQENAKGKLNAVRLTDRDLNSPEVGIWEIEACCRVTGL
jgi:hypothetical protein